MSAGIITPERPGLHPTYWKFRHESGDGRLLWGSDIGDVEHLGIEVNSPEWFAALGDQRWQPNALADEGEEIILDVFLRGASAPASLYVGLLSATPTDTTTLATMTEQIGRAHV